MSVEENGGIILNKFSSIIKQKPNNDHTLIQDPPEVSTERTVIFSDLDNNLQWIKDSLGHSTDVIQREFIIGFHPERRAAVIYIDGLTDVAMVQEFIIKTLQTDTLNQTAGEALPSDYLFLHIKKHAVAVSQITEISDYEKMFSSLLRGDAILLIDQCQQGIAAGAAGGEDRGVQTPEDQSVVRGPRDAFTENLRTNTALIRRKIHNPNLWLKTRTIGSVSQTNVAIMYIQGIAEPQVIDEIHARLDKINISGVLESGIIEQLIEDTTLTPFPTIYNTERPDVIAAGLMEGRVAILVDRTPFVLLVPALFNHFFQAAEDYYQRSDFGLLRLLRFISFIIALMGPSVYIAITTFHQEMLPTQLMISIAAGREGVPFPAFIEAFMMETIFEILREAGVRMPRAIGQAVSIVGALVVGQAAVEAGLISPGMVIVVSITAISSFVLPSYNLGIAVRLLRFPIMGLAAVAGFFGLFIGVCIILLHLCGLKSFGVLYMSPFAPYNKNDMKDSLFRFPKKGLSLASSSIGKQKKR